ncbi:MAG: ADP-ribose diphosphatase [Oceanospirillaceae bacterium]|jgi:ADP-ribose diphosphatase
MPIKPEVLKVKQSARSRLFLVEELKLKFSNGVERTYERLASRGNGAVMMIAIDSDNNLLLVREYAGGIEDYTLSLPKGAVDDGETIFQAADRELKEEVGFGANRIDFLKEMTTAPNYMGHKLQAVIARDLYPCKLEGDEPEPLEVIKWPLSDIDNLALNPEFTEGRAIAGLYMAKHFIENSKD